VAIPKAFQDVQFILGFLSNHLNGCLEKRSVSQTFDDCVLSDIFFNDNIHCHSSSAWVTNCPWQTVFLPQTMNKYWSREKK
jgi:hypothetical protein